MEIPTNLKHAPVFTVENYEDIDGRLTKEETDTKGLSLGIAQWSKRGNYDVSAKVWRYTGEKWSRQSEELPLHRVLDLAIMIAEAKKYLQEAYQHEKLYDPEQVEIAKVALQGNAMRLGICTNNEHIDEDIKLFNETMRKDDELIGERIQRLKEALKDVL